MNRTPILPVIWLLSLVCTLGCATSRTTNTSRTATEQVLLSSAIDRSLSNVSFDQLRSRTVFLDDKYLDSVDKGYLIGTLRHKALASGALLAKSADDAEIVIEVRSGGIGTDTEESFIGIPSVGVPGMAISVPDIKLASRSTQLGTAKIGLIANDPKTGAAVGLGGQSTALTKNDDLFVFGMGPYRSGEIKQERETALGYEPATRIFSTASSRNPQVSRTPAVSLVDGQVSRVAELPELPAQFGDGVIR